MDKSYYAQLTFHVEQNRLVVVGQLTRETLMSLYTEKKSFSGVNLIDVTSVTHVDSSGLALLTQLCLMNKTDKKKLIGINEKLQSLIQAYRLPL
ncbi:anti-sigma B factor antagonist [Thorsellia kenyensis]|uniref:Anti-sigma B factor antagonist n=1 Tax=Thorsellia kenyensis TaxID=1549888 RepID=A0ABV6C7U4_9GAMM